MKPIKVTKSYRLPPKLIERIERASEKLELSNTDVIEKAVEEYLDKIERAEKRKSGDK